MAFLCADFQQPGVYFMKIRDTQRSKLYRAEREAWQVLSCPLPTISDIRQYLEKQSTRKPLQRRYGASVNVTDWELEIADGRGCQHARANGTQKITIPRWARTEWVVLHEWAHIIHKRLNISFVPGSGILNYGSRSFELRGPAAPHGWQFASIYLDLVHFCISEEAARALKVAFKAHNVRYRPKPTRTVTEEQLARLAAMRASQTTAAVSTT